MQVEVLLLLMEMLLHIHYKLG